MRKLRLAHGLCEDPLRVHAAHNDTVAAREVHHIRSIRNAPHLAYDITNLMALCAKCHAAVEDANDNNEAHRKGRT
jgi:5-methylcytosine-specific restriction endonuclease McrA